MVLAIAVHHLGPITVSSRAAESVWAQSPPSVPTVPIVPAPPTTPLSSPTVSSTPLPALPPRLPASTAPPLLTSGDYRDPTGRFTVAVLQGYRVSSLAGSVLMESLDGHLAYTVVAQPAASLGPNPGLNPEALAQVATIVFQRGEGFQPGTAQPEAGGGIVINWTGSLTIAGAPQPVGGVILARSSARYVVLALVAATQAGATQVPGAVAAIANSLQPL